MEAVSTRVCPSGYIGMCLTCSSFPCPYLFGEVFTHEEKQIAKLPDYQVRLELSRSIGLEKVPKLDKNAINRLSGILKNDIKQDEIDSVEMIKKIRG